MPTYTYACTDCDEQIEVVQSFTADPLTECPHCHGRLRKVFHPVGVVFKGSGFYRTDSRSGKNGSSGPSEGKADKAGSEKSGSEKAGSEKSGSQERGAATNGSGKASGSSGTSPASGSSGGSTSGSSSTAGASASSGSGSRSTSSAS